MTTETIPAESVEFVIGSNIAEATSIALSEMTAETWSARVHGLPLLHVLVADEQNVNEVANIPATEAVNALIFWETAHNWTIQQSVEDFLAEGPITNPDDTDATPVSLTVKVYN